MSDAQELRLLRAGYDAQRALLGRAHTELTELRAKLAEAEADAARYRWLRSRIPGATYRIMGVIYSEGGSGVDVAIDAAIDAERGP